jgi:hypothetical protein
MSLFRVILSSIYAASAVCQFNIVSDKHRDISPQVIGHAGSSGYLPESTVEVHHESEFDLLNENIGI